MFLTALALLASRAWAQQAASAAGGPPPRPKVILLSPSAAPPMVGEALVRLRSELMLEGFDAEVTQQPLGAPSEVRATLERIAPTLTASATALVAVVPGPEPTAAELWVVDRLTGKTVVRRVRADPKAAARAAEVLSVRAVELLRASFLELAITAARGDAAATAAATGAADVVAPVDVPAVAPVVAPVVERWAAEPLVPDWHWAFEAGGGAMALVDAASGGIAAELLPIARIERAFGARLCARVGAAGLGTMARVSTPSGYANVSQSVLLADVVARFRRGRRLEPIVSVGAGALRVSADGHEMAPYQSASGARWSMAADAGVGVRVPLQPHRFELGVEVHALLAEPYPVVRFFDRDIARAGRPSVLGGITLLGGL